VWNPGHGTMSQRRSSRRVQAPTKLGSILDGVPSFTATGAAVDYTNTPLSHRHQRDGVGWPRHMSGSGLETSTEVVVYNRALSASEVGQLAGIGVSP